MKSTYDNKLEALQKDLDTERAERKKLEDQLRMARYWKKNPHKWKIKPSAINLNWLVIPYNWLDFFIFIFMSKRKFLHINSNSAHVSKQKVITWTLLSVLLVVKKNFRKKSFPPLLFTRSLFRNMAFFSYSQISSWLKDVFFGWKYDKHGLMQKVFVSFL